MKRALQIGGIGCGGLLALIILVSVLSYELSGKSKPSTAPPTTTTTQLTKGCLPVSKATVQTIANGLNNRRIRLRYDAVAAKLSDTKGKLYAVTGRIVGPGTGVAGPALATWITDSITRSPHIVWSGEGIAALFTQWGKAPYLYNEGDILLDQGCFPADG